MFKYSVSNIKDGGFKYDNNTVCTLLSFSTAQSMTCYFSLIIHCSDWLNSVTDNPSFITVSENILEWE